jgi:hypothetical protein
MVTGVRCHDLETHVQFASIPDLVSDPRNEIFLIV